MAKSTMASGSGWTIAGLEDVLATVVRVMRRATNGHGESELDKAILDEFMARNQPETDRDEP